MPWDYPKQTLADGRSWPLAFSHARASRWGMPDNRWPYTLFQHMTDTEQQAVPPGFRQITEGRIRTTDLIWGESGGWAVPHVFLVGTDIADDGRSIARPHVKKPGGRS